MPEQRFQDIKKVTIEEDMPGLPAKTFYRNKYYSLWMGSRHFPELTRDQERYLKKSFWRTGTTAAFIIPGSKPDPTMEELLSNSSSKTLILEHQLQPNGVLEFADYAPIQYNVNDLPSIVSLIPRRGATFIPSEPQVVNKDVVIMWAHESHKAVSALVNYYIDLLVDIEVTINVNLINHRLPRLVVISPEDEKRVKSIMDAVKAGKTEIFLSAADAQAIKNVLDGGGTYIIDKLQQFKVYVENSLLTFLGMNNTPHEKAERLITDEANSNNQLIMQSGDCFKDVIDESCEDVTDILGFKLTQEVKEYQEQLETPKEDDEDAEN